MRNEDYFGRLETELASLVRAAAHLDEAGARVRRRTWLARRATVALILVLALAVTLISEFPSSASGAGPRAPIGAIGA